MSSYWCNFGKNGDPNGENLPKWDAYTSYNRKAMEIGEKICMIDRPGSPTVDFEVDYTVGNL